MFVSERQAVCLKLFSEKLDFVLHQEKISLKSRHWRTLLQKCLWNNSICLIPTRIWIQKLINSAFSIFKQILRYERNIDLLHGIYYRWTFYCRDFELFKCFCSCVTKYIYIYYNPYLTEYLSANAMIFDIWISLSLLFI